jgi:hypothetical protein
MNGNTQADYQTRAIITGLTILCLTALLILGKISSAEYLATVALFGAGYGYMKHSETQKANGGMKTDYNSMLATGIRESAAMASDTVIKALKNGTANEAK